MQFFPVRRVVSAGAESGTDEILSLPNPWLSYRAACHCLPLYEALV